MLHEAEQEAHEQQAQETQVLPEGVQARFQRQDKGDSGQGQQQRSPVPDCMPASRTGKGAGFPPADKPGGLIAPPVKISSRKLRQANQC